MRLLNPQILKSPNPQNVRVNLVLLPRKRAEHVVPHDEEVVLETAVVVVVRAARVRDGLAEDGAVEIRPTDDGDVRVRCEDHRGALAAAGNFDGTRARVQDLKLARFERRV